MKFVITDAGLRAAQEARANGYQISLTSFAVGSAYNYAPTVSDTKLHGAELHRGGISGFKVIDANTVEYTCIMDRDVGPFAYGEVGLYTEDGTLFALASQPKVIEKTRGDATVSGNKIAIEAQLKLTQAEAVFQFDLFNLANAKLLEIPSVAHLKPPVISDSNAYLTLSRDVNGMTVFAYRAADFEWSFPTFTRVGTFTVTEAGSGYTSAPTVSFSGGNGQGAAATATVSNGGVTGLTLTNGGSGYTSAPKVTISGGGGAGATAIAHIDRGIGSITVNNGGSGYTSAPTVTIGGGNGSGATARAVVSGGRVTSIVVTAPGKGYTGTPHVTISGGGGSAATATANVSGVVTSVELVGNSTTSLACNGLNDSAARMKHGKYMIQFLTGALKGFVRFVTSSTPTALAWAGLEKVGSVPKAGDQFNLYMCSAETIEDHKSDPNAHPMYALRSYVDQRATEFDAAMDKLRKASFTVNGNMTGNLNNLRLKHGLFRVTSAVNGPSPSGILFVYDNAYTDDNGTNATPDAEKRTVQQFFSDTGKIYTRRWTGNGWTAWTGSNGILTVDENPAVQHTRILSLHPAALAVTGTDRNGYPSWTSTVLPNEDIEVTLHIVGTTNLKELATIDLTVACKIAAGDGNRAVTMLASTQAGSADVKAYCKCVDNRLVLALGSDNGIMRQNNASFRVDATLTATSDNAWNEGHAKHWGFNLLNTLQGFQASRTYRNFALRGNLGTQDLNTLFASVGFPNDSETELHGVYFQPLDSNAQLDRHYPTTKAGTLRVFPSAYHGVQVYLTYTGEEYMRASTHGKTWGDWKRIDGGSGGVPVGTIVSFPNNVTNVKGFLRANGTTFNQVAYPELYQVLGNKNTLPNIQDDSIGQMAFFPFDTVPEGWLEIDGSVVDQSRYPQLFNKLGTKYGARGQLPDPRNCYLRADKGEGTLGYNVGVKMESNLENHIHVIGSGNNSDDLVMSARPELNVPLTTGSNAGADKWSVAGEGNRLSFGVNPPHSGNPQYTVLTQKPEIHNSSFRELYPNTFVGKLCIKAVGLNYYIKAYGEVDNPDNVSLSNIAQQMQDKASLAQLEDALSQMGTARNELKEFVRTLSFTDRIKVLVGEVAIGGTIPLPAGFSEDQCKWFVFEHPIGFSRRVGGGYTHTKYPQAIPSTDYFRPVKTPNRVLTLSGQEGSATMAIYNSTNARYQYVIIGVK